MLRTINRRFFKLSTADFRRVRRSKSTIFQRSEMSA